MTKNQYIHRVLGTICALLVASSLGCSDEAKDSLRDAATDAENTAKSVAEDAGEMAKETSKQVADAGKEAKDAATKFSKDTIAYLSSLKERIGKLDSLKQKPEELKKVVNDLLKSLEAKSEGIKRSKTASDALAAVKEKLVALKNYLAGKVDQAKLEEHIKAVVEAAKKGLGLDD